MSRQQREALEVVLRAAPFDLNQTPEQHRRSFDAFIIKPYPADVTEKEMILGGVRALELTIAGHQALPVVLYFHGGGYVVGSARTGAHLASDLARRLGGRGLSVEYRLGPENPYPASVEDGLAAYTGLLTCGTDPRQVVLAGDSAGGGLAVATLLP